MQSTNKTVDTYLLMLTPFGVAALVWALARFPFGRPDAGMAALLILTAVFSSAFRIQLPRTKIHLTLSDTLIFLSFLLYGGEVSVVFAVLGTTCASLVFRRQGVTLTKKTAAINILVAALSTFVSAMAVNLVFGRVELIVKTGVDERFIWLLGTMALAQFFVNSLCVSAFVAQKTGNTVWRVWNEYCLNALVMYCSGAVVAGLCVVALQKIDVFLFAAVVGFFALIYLTYRRYADDVKATGAKAEQAERDRAEQAEAHVRELEHYVAELEKSSRALSESREKFRHAAYHDALTGLPNRNKFLEELTRLIEKCRIAPENRYAVIFLDLNRFKTLNESLGHSVGDRLIMQVGERLVGMRPEGGLVGRFSGDEFAILLTEIGDAAEATWFAEEVGGRIAEPFSVEGREIFTSVCIGIAFGGRNYQRAEEILRDADIAMYHAKEKQKPFVIFDREMHARAVSLLEMETDLRYAIERSEFELYYQPIVDLEEMRLRGFEALVRWNHPHRGLVSPDAFIPLAEATGLIVPMTIQILRSASRQLVDWKLQNAAHNSLMVSVNLSVKHLSHPGLVDQITSILDESGLDPSCLKLEITESSVMENAEKAISVLKQIKATGVNLSIDDFGTGYSSLSYLHRFPIDTLKIDRSFVSSMDAGTENGEIVRTVIALAKALKLSVIAEGIESINQLHQLQMLGCRYGQGYLFSRPLPPAEAEKVLLEEFRWREMLPAARFDIAAQDIVYTQITVAQ